ncbi:dTDP-4-dehydrorhamnose 3,5-epimerase family protein [Nocardiopsis lambiniae]|uniref:dTDP-4-dehydrorhamnose 3,5-epimerase family protein n=1 Tax=Nocardiopsis lambiniae TaxID=3075539 RepID=A0ABU2MA95_9ACTN|nr:dTDP-4-dehydrorhamnose 3,5-epimerase family protein [Nocardiopsis sp. DSM 44743]MDT0329529.1 dTDP-4-dehydrorhamnose 3,5-epimerase family protein [Nocardiopsis sp. DSM 44743]
MTLRARPLGIEGAYLLPYEVFDDERGLFATPLQGAELRRVSGHGLFPVVQTSYSVSRRGVVRGVHYTQAPPGMAKYVHCPRGRALDIAVDLRVGSPTFRRHESVVLEPAAPVALYLPVGVGHLFVSLEDDTIVTYSLSVEYDPRNERALHPLDPDLGLPLPEDVTPILSERDRAAPGLAQVMEEGGLPDHRTCVELEEALWRQGTPV